MSIWFFLLIPIIGAAILLKFFHTKLSWWEVSVPLISCLIFIGIFKFTVEKVRTSDTEYHGALLVKATYYEYWETYVRRTCTRTVSCGKNCTTTVTYDCSYCDKNPEHWTATNSLGEEFRISKEFYDYLRKKWSATPKFIELNRDINHGGFGCGEDGDAYEIYWDNQPLTSEATTTSHSYENRIQAAHTAFDFAEITKNDIKTYSLLPYPEVNGFQQSHILGADSIPWLTAAEKNRFYQWGMYINGKLGPEKHARIYYILFKDKPHLAGKMQEAYWDGGNDNELVICIGLSSTSRELQWVYPFSWSPERKILPDMREDIMRYKVFDVDAIAQETLKNVQNEFKRKDFKEFSYVTVDPPGWAKWVTFFVTLIITGLIGYWAVTNEIDSRYDPLKEFISDLFSGNLRNRRNRW